MTEQWLEPDTGQDASMGRRVARGLTWTLTQTWGGQTLSLIVFVILARLLTPDDFGLVALAAVFVSLAQLVVDQGLGDALVQRREITRSHVDTAFWVAVLSGLGLTVAGLLLAGPIAALVREPALAPVLRVLSITYIFSALSSIPTALLERRLAFRLLAMRTILSITGGGFAGIAMAIGGFGAWALVGQQLVAAVLSAVLLMSVAQWRPRLHLARDEFSSLFVFGIRVVGSDFLGFVTRNADNFLIGVFLGTVPLGIYAVGYRILDTSQRLLINAARRIAFPAFSRMQHDPSRLARAYLRLNRVANVLILPGYLGLALVAPELTVVVFGHSWSESGWVAAILFLSGPVLGLQAFSGSALYATGHPEVVLRFRVLSTVVNVVAFAAALPFGILAVASAFTLRAYLFLPLLLSWTQRYAGAATGEYLRQLLRLAVPTAGMTVVVAAAKIGLIDRVGDALLLGTETAAGSAVFGLLLWMIDRPLLQEVTRVLMHALPGAERMGQRFGRRRAENP